MIEAERSGVARLERGMSATAVLALLVLFLVNLENYGQRLIMSILLPAIKADVALTDGQLGILLGGAFGLCYAVAGVPLTRFADASGRLKCLSIALLFWSAATGMIGFARSFLHVLLARLALGLGQSVCIPTSHSLLTDYVAEDYRALAFGLHSSGGVAGATLCVMLGGYLQTRFGWRETLWLVAASGIALAILMSLVLREPKRVSDQGPAASSTSSLPLLEVMRHLFRRRSYALVLVSVCLAMLLDVGMSLWLPSFYVRRFGLPVEQVGVRYGLVMAIGGLPGGLLGGWLANRLARRDVRWLVWFPAAMYLLAAPLGFSMLLVNDATFAFTLNTLYALCIYSTSGAFWAATFVKIPSSMRATTSAVTLLIAGLTGVSLGPVLVGGLSELWGSLGASRSLQAALLSLEVLSFCVVVPLLYAARPLSSLSDPTTVTPGHA